MLCMCNGRMISCYCGRINALVKSCAHFLSLFFLPNRTLVHRLFLIVSFDATFVFFFVASRVWFAFVRCFAPLIFASFYSTHLHMVLPLTWIQIEQQQLKKELFTFAVRSVAVSVILSCWCIIFFIFFIHSLWPFCSNLHNTCRNGMFLIFLYILHVDFLRFMFSSHVACTLPNTSFLFCAKSNFKKHNLLD